MGSFAAVGNVLCKRTPRGKGSLLLPGLLVFLALGLGACQPLASPGQGRNLEIAPAEPTATAISPVLPAPSPAPTPHPSPTPSATPSLGETPGALLLPVPGAALPQRPELLPGAPRPYRAGVHEGIDFYTLADGSPLTTQTPVRAALGGRVIRADHNYRELTAEEFAEVEGRSRRQGFTTPEDLDLLRGRQVWLRHQGGIVTRYAHLSAIAAHLKEGQEVLPGELLGGAGNSGTSETLLGPEVGVHLHFEVRLGEGYLGQSLSPAESLPLLEPLFRTAP